MSAPRFDAHCHIFTFEYLLLEAKAIVRDWRKPEYHFQWPSGGLVHSEDSRNPANNRLGVGEIVSLLRQLRELVCAAAGSEADNFAFLKKQMGKAYRGDEAHIVPLMMDIYPILSSPLNEGQSEAPVAAALMAEAGDSQTDWEAALDELAGQIKAGMTVTRGAASTEGAGPSSELDFPEGVEELALQLIERERNLSETRSPMALNAADTALLSRKAPSYTDGISGFYHTDGYCHHMNRLMDLVGEGLPVHPFVAIDPRREGIVETLKSGAFFTGERRFTGVKLYPRIGYHPRCKPMEDVYQYCHDNKLPITFHCGKGGFPPSEKWAYASFGDPRLFDSVLSDYPNLRIDFAHMGSSDTSDDWKQAVLDIVKRRPNAYTDFSCYTDPVELKRMKETYWDPNPRMRDRLMFGTDFDVMYFTGKVTIQSYYQSFKDLFNTDMDLLTRANPLRFLGLQ